MAKKKRKIKPDPSVPEDIIIKKEEEEDDQQLVPYELQRLQMYDRIVNNKYSGSNINV